MRYSILECLCFVQTVRCGNVILSSVHGRLTSSKTFTCIQSSSPSALCAKPQNRHLGKGIHHCHNFRDYRLYIHKMVVMTQGHETNCRKAKQYLEDRAAGTWEGIFRIMKCISLTTIMLCNILHIVYLGMLKHLMYWVASFLE